MWMSVVIEVARPWWRCKQQHTAQEINIKTLRILIKGTVSKYLCGRLVEWMDKS
jgi:hypothetical protein